MRQPAIDTAGKRPHSGNSLFLQQQRHPGATRFIGSRTIKYNVAIAGKFLVTHFKLFDPHANGSRYRLRQRRDVERLAQVDDQHLGPSAERIHQFLRRYSSGAQPMQKPLALNVFQ